MSPPPTPRSTRSRLSARSRREPRPPVSLLPPSHRPSAPQPAISRIFASPTSSTGAAGHERSETKLSRQLDGDLGGRSMGLRSRRSSSATIRSMASMARGASGAAAPKSEVGSLAEEMEEEARSPHHGEQQEQEAGPSRRPISSADLPSRLDARQELGVSARRREKTDASDASDSTLRPAGQKLDPKRSSSWLRWNQPGPAFPRSPPANTKGSAEIGSARKGKGRATDVDIGRSRPPYMPPTPTAEEQEPAREGVASEQHEDGREDALLSPRETSRLLVPSKEPPETGSPVGTVTPRRKGWWGRMSSTADLRALPAHSTGTAGTAPAASTRAEIGHAVHARTATGVKGKGRDPANGMAASNERTATVPNPAVTAAVAPIEETSSKVESASPPESTAETSATPTWGSYLTWKRALSSAPAPAAPASEPPAPAPNQSVTTDSRPTEVDNGGAHAQSEGYEMPNGVPVEEPTAAPAASVSEEQTARAGWAPYLYSFVARSGSPVPLATPEKAAELPASGIEPDPSPHSTPETAPSTLPTETDSPSSLAASERPTASIDAQQSSGRQGQTPHGWLSYLAFRSTQRRLPAAREGTAGGKEPAEEIMDFSNDPNFPSTPRTPAPASKHDTIRASGFTKPTGKSAEEKLMPPPPLPIKSAKPAPGTPTQPISRSVASNKNLSVSISASPEPDRLSSSPAVPAGPNKAAKPASISSKQSKKVSALPAPPTVPSAQPNLLIPSFSTTFGRPPRSLLPSALPSSPNPTSATAGLAWRALSAASSYVYSPTAPSSSVKREDWIEEDQKETRGRAAGRRIGADLPRRMGLGGLGGGKDDGWKHVRRVTVVGVHGWFPAKMFNTVIGEPTGTSQKFASMMAAAVRSFFAERGVNEKELRVTLMPLEGEGTIESRVDRLYKSYLSNPAWINDLRRSDLILFAAHSQGCIVTTHLISRLIAQGHIRTPLNADSVARCEWAFGPIGVVPDSPKKRSAFPASSDSMGAWATPGSEGGYQKVGLLAMCGVHLGPFYSINSSTVIQPYLQWFENAAARELFDFQDTASAVSAEYQKSLGEVLENGVKVLLLSSLNDQVVPIYGSSFSVASHPLLLRALFVDGNSYASALPQAAGTRVLNGDKPGPPTPAGLEPSPKITSSKSSTGGHPSGESKQYESQSMNGPDDPTQGTGADFMTNLLCFAFMLRNAGLDDQRLVEHLSEATAGSLTGIGHSTPYEDPAPYSLLLSYLLLATPPSFPLPSLAVEAFSAKDGRNDYELPWIMRSLVDSEEVRDLFPAELRELKEGVGAWRPGTKALKEIKKRLEPMAGRPPRTGQGQGVGVGLSSTSLSSMGGQSTLRRDW